MKRILLDTNAYVRLLAGDEGVLEVLGQADTVYLSAIGAGVVLAGFRGGNRLLDNGAQLLQFLKRPTVG